MSLPEVGQARMLSTAFLDAVNKRPIRSLALIGCAGGNGLSVLEGKGLERVLCIDVNEEYLRALTSRFQDGITGLECHCTEIESFQSQECVDLIFAGLIFEYTRLEEAVRSVSALANVGSMLHVILQLKNEHLPTVSASPYLSDLSEISGFFKYVDVSRFLELFRDSGFTLLGRQDETLASGKSFLHLDLEKTK